MNVLYGTGIPQWTTFSDSTSVSYICTKNQPKDSFYYIYTYHNNVFATDFTVIVSKSFDYLSLHILILSNVVNRRDTIYDGTLYVYSVHTNLYKDHITEVRAG